MIPVALAWLGVFASILLVVFLPLQLTGLFGGAVNWFASVTWLGSLPMLGIRAGACRVADHQRCSRAGAHVAHYKRIIARSLFWQSRF